MLLIKSATKENLLFCVLMIPELMNELGGKSELTFGRSMRGLE